MRKHNLQVFKYRNDVFIIDVAGNHFAFDGSGWSRFHGLMWSKGKWASMTGPAMVYNDRTKQYSVIDKKQWRRVSWLEALLVSGDSKRKIRQSIKRVLG